MQQSVSHKKINANATSFEEKRDRALESSCVLEITAILGAVCAVKGRDDEKVALYQGVLERNLLNPPVVSQCLFHLRALGDGEARRGVEAVLAKGYQGAYEEAYFMGLQSLMALRTFEPSDLQAITLGLFGTTERLGHRVASDIKRLDIDRLGKMLRENEYNIYLCKPFAPAFAQFVFEAKAVAEALNQYYDQLKPPTRYERSE